MAKKLPKSKAALQRGRREYAQGEYVTLEQLKHDLEVDWLKEREVTNHLNKEFL